MLIRPNTLKERILIYGQEGSGKSCCPFSIAQVFQLNNFPGRFRILCNDGESAERTHQTIYQPLTNVDIKNIFDWEDLNKQVEEFYKTCAPNDWLVLDLICRTWDWVQDYYTRQTFKKGQEEYFMEVRRKKALNESKKQAPGAFEGFLDWQYIKLLYNTFIRELCFEAKCNLICVSSASLLDSDNDDKETRNVYSRIGFKPAGLKKIGGAFHTVIHTSACQGEFYAQTAKDRGRQYLSGRLNNFAIDYLIGVCGWKVVL